MSDDNKEGAGVPVAVVGKGNGGGVGITYLPALYSLPHGTKLYATPPAAMPAAPSDAVDATMFMVYEYARISDGIDSAEGEARGQQLVAMRAKGNEIRAALSQTMQPQAAPAAGEQAGAVAWINGASLTTFGIDRERYPLGGGGDMATARYMRSDHHDTPLYLAAPAIAAREQEALAVDCPHCWQKAGEPCIWPETRTRNRDTPHDARIAALADRKEPPATPQAETLIDRVAELMRGIDAYAYDYRTDGKLAASRQAVSNALLAAFNADLLKLIRTQPTTVQQAEDLTDEQIRDGFRDYDKELVARHRTPWQIWRDSSAWAQTALKGMQSGERKEQS